MFGYVKTYTSELYVRENEFYKGVYCGLCRSLGKCTGQFSKVTLNYDFVFGALLRMAATGEKISFEKKRCIIHPIRKRLMATRCASLDFCARAASLLSYHKVNDDVCDEKGAKRAKARFLRALMRGMRRKARKQLGVADTVISSRLAELSEIEKLCLESADIPADCFGHLMGELLSLSLPEKEAKIIKNAAFHLGRWIYLVDAADDFSDDVKKGRFNPLYCLYKEDTLSDVHKETLFNALTAELMQISAALDLLECENANENVFGIIKNILTLGMPNTAERVLYGEKGNSHERSL